MDYTKQLIKAINDLTKAVNKNTEAIRENTSLNELDVNTIESGTPDDLNRFLGKAYQPENGVLTTDGLGKTSKLNFGTGSVMYSGSWDSPKGIEIIPRDNDTYKSVIDKLNKLSGF